MEDTDMVDVVKRYSIWDNLSEPDQKRLIDFYRKFRTMPLIDADLIMMDRLSRAMWRASKY